MTSTFTPHLVPGTLVYDRHGERVYEYAGPGDPKYPGMVRTTASLLHGGPMRIECNPRDLIPADAITDPDFITVRAAEVGTKKNPHLRPFVLTNEKANPERKEMQKREQGYTSADTWRLLEEGVEADGTPWYIARWYKTKKDALHEAAWMLEIRDYWSAAERIHDHALALKGASA